jgi:hypothetical protein
MHPLRPKEVALRTVLAWHSDMWPLDQRLMVSRSLLASAC